jgi:hypothetical protein
VTDVSSDKFFNGETADDFVNRFDDINNNLAFEATIEKSAKDTSKISPAKDTSIVILDLSETISVFVAKISSKNLSNGDLKIDTDIALKLR